MRQYFPMPHPMPRRLGAISASLAVLVINVGMAGATARADDPSYRSLPGSPKPDEIARLATALPIPMNRLLAEPVLRSLVEQYQRQQGSSGAIPSNDMRRPQTGTEDPSWVPPAELVERLLRQSSPQDGLSSQPLDQEQLAEVMNEIMKDWLRQNGQPPSSASSGSRNGSYANELEGAPSGHSPARSQIGDGSSGGDAGGDGASGSGPIGRWIERLTHRFSRSADEVPSEPRGLRSGSTNLGNGQDPESAERIAALIKQFQAALPKEESSLSRGGMAGNRVRDIDVERDQPTPPSGIAPRFPGSAPGARQSRGHFAQRINRILMEAAEGAASQPEFGEVAERGSTSFLAPVVEKAAELAQHQGEWGERLARAWSERDDSDGSVIRRWRRPSWPRAFGGDSFSGAPSLGQIYRWPGRIAILGTCGLMMLVLIAARGRWMTWHVLGSTGRRMEWTPSRIGSPAELVRQVDQFLVERFGRASSVWNCRQAADALASIVPAERAGVASLMSAYQRARYAPAHRQPTAGHVRDAAHILWRIARSAGEGARKPGRSLPRILFGKPRPPAMD